MKKPFILLPLLLILPIAAAVAALWMVWGQTLLSLVQTFVKAVLLP